MLILNFSHPLTDEQQARLQELTGEETLPVLNVPVQFDNEQPYPPQVEAALSQLPLTPTDWQTEPLLIVVPGHSMGAAVLLAAVHGRCGYFPTCVRLRPITGSTPTQFEVAEIINLQRVREHARGTRTG